MRRKNKRFPSKLLIAGAGATLAAVVAALVIGSNADEVVSLASLPTKTPIHGLAADREDPSHVLIATHHGLSRAGPDGKAERISAVQDFMSFNPHPSDPKTLYASGHPAGGGNLGFIASADGGRTWTQISPGVSGPVDFHQMTVSPAEPGTIYGAYRSLQVSRDGGHTWTMVGHPPDKLIDLAASARSPDVLYAATEAGLFISRNAGRSWTPLLEGVPVSLAAATPHGVLYAFVVGSGLLRSPKEPLSFATLGVNSGDSDLRHLTVDPQNPNRLYAATGRGEVLTSADQGRTWIPFSISNL